MTEFDIKQTLRELDWLEEALRRALTPQALKRERDKLRDQVSAYKSGFQAGAEEMRKCLVWKITEQQAYHEGNSTDTIAYIRAMLQDFKKIIESMPLPKENAYDQAP